MSWGDVAIAAGPSIVAVVAIGAAFRQQRRALAHERELADVADARRVFDDAAVELHRASVALSVLLNALVLHGEDHWKKAPNAVLETRAAAEALRAMLGRLGVRLPAGNAALDSYAAAQKATEAAADTTAELVLDSDTGKAVADVETNHERLIGATADFMRAANDIVGTRVPDDD